MRTGTVWHANTRLQKASWATVIGILQSDAEPEATLFAAITLRGKVGDSLAECPHLSVTNRS